MWLILYYTNLPLLFQPTLPGQTVKSLYLDRERTQMRVRILTAEGNGVQSGELALRHLNEATIGNDVVHSVREYVVVRRRSPGAAGSRAPCFWQWCRRGVGDTFAKKSFLLFLKQIANYCFSFRTEFAAMSDLDLQKEQTTPFGQGAYPIALWTTGATRASV